MRRKSSAALVVALALAVGYLVVPDFAGATDFTTSATCTAVNTCSGATTNGPGGSVTVTFIGGTSTSQLFHVATTGTVQINSVVGNLSGGGIASNLNTNTDPVFTVTTTNFVNKLDVNWTDTSTTSTSTSSSSTSSTSSTSSSSTSSTSSTTSSSTSTTTSTTSTTTTTLPRGPGNGPVAIRPDNTVNGGADSTAVRGNERVDVVTLLNGTPSLATWNGTQWSGYTGLGTPPNGITGDPAIVSWAPGRLDVFVRGGDNKLWQNFSTDAGATWSGWVQPFTDGVLASAPAVDSRGPGQLDVFVIGTDSHIYQRFYNGAWNAGWLDQSTPTSVASGSRPSAVSRDGIHVDVFVESADQKLWQRTWDGSNWSIWNPPVGSSGTLATSPEVTSWDNDNLLVFTVGTDGHAYALPFGAGGWGTWVRLGGTNDIFQGNLGADARGSGRFDMFGRGTDNIEYELFQ